MRISTTQVVESSLINISRAQDRYALAQQRTGTGKVLNRPSDDPAGLQQSLNLHAAIDNIEQYQRNIEDARGFMGVTDGALDQVGKLLQQARTLALQGANETLSAESRTILARQVAHIASQVAYVANTTYGSRYVFGGQRTTDPPLVSTGAEFVYKGGSSANANDRITVDIAPGESVVVNVTGDMIFPPVLDVLTRLQNNIANAQTGLITHEDLKALDDVIDTVLRTRSEFGSRTQQLDRTKARLDQAQLSLTTLLSQVEDADVAKTVVDLKAAELTYQSALAATARGFQQSLLDFLR